MAAQHVYAQQQLERRGAVLLGVTLSECRPIWLSFHESYYACMYVPMSRGSEVSPLAVVTAAFGMHGDAWTMLNA